MEAIFYRYIFPPTPIISLLFLSTCVLFFLAGIRPGANDGSLKWNFVRGSQNYPGVRLWRSRPFIFPSAYREKADRRLLALARDMDYVVTLSWRCAILFMKKIVPQNDTSEGEARVRRRCCCALRHRSIALKTTARLWNLFNYITTTFSRVLRSCPSWARNACPKIQTDILRSLQRNEKNLRKANKRVGIFIRLIW